jgi:hypothetical protein
MAAQKYLTISGGSVVSASPNPTLGYLLQGTSGGAAAILKVGPDTSNHTIAVVAQQGGDGQLLDYSAGNLTLTHGISVSNGHLTIFNEAGGTVTLNGASTVANGSTFQASGPPSLHAHHPGSYVLNGSLNVSHGSMANFQDAKVGGHGTVNIGAGAYGDTNTVTMNNVLAGLHVNVANHSHLILRAEDTGGAISFHGTISEAAGATVSIFGAASSAVREIFHTATGTLDLLNKVGTQVASLQFAPGSREYTEISPGAQYVAITTSPIAGPAAHTLPTIFTH